MKKLTTNLGLKKKINYKTLLGDATLDKNYEPETLESAGCDGQCLRGVVSCDDCCQLDKNYKPESNINKYSSHYNPKNNLASMPDEYLGQFRNGGCPDRCDMLQGPCACGAWHHQEEWPDDVQLKVFGFISDKETICKRKPFI